MSTIDHILMIGFGGPPRPEDVTPYLQEVTCGMPIPPERIAEVAHHYEQTGGASPYNAHTQQLFDKLREYLRMLGINLPMFLGMRNWHPFLRDVVEQIHRKRLGAGLGVVLAPHRCEASYDRYRKNVEDAKRHALATDIEYDYLEPWHDHPLFIKAKADRVREALDRLTPEPRRTAHLLFTAHSIPVEMAKGSQYEEEFATSSRLVAEDLQFAAWSLAYQSRSGSPKQPWLEPDVETALQTLRREGVRTVVVVPIGFLSDHMEVLYDLDIEAQQQAQRLGLQMVRASTVMDHPQFVAMLGQLIAMRIRR